MGETAAIPRSVARSVTLDAPISATATLAEIAEELVRAALADHPEEENISLLAIYVSHLEKHWKVQLEFPLGLEDEKRRPGPREGWRELVKGPSGKPKIKLGACANYDGSRSLRRPSGNFPCARRFVN